MAGVGLVVLVLGCLGLAFAVDASVVAWVRKRGHGIGADFANWIGFWGDWYGVTAVALMLWAIAKLRRDATFQRLVLLMGVSALLSGASANVIRGVTGRTRPAAAAAEGWYGASHGLMGAGGSRHAFQSFPSAHTAVVSGFFAPLGIMALGADRRRIRILSGFVFWGASGLMAWARVWTESHHPSDVVAGMALGLLAGFCLLRGPLRHFGSLPVPDRLPDR